MLRLSFFLLLLTACATVKTGGKNAYRYDPKLDYSFADLKTLAPEIVTTSKRDPHFKKLDDLFDPKLPDLKRIGIIIFESKLQSTRSGLAANDVVYLSASGKQLLTEGLLNMWEELFPMTAPEITFLDTEMISKTKSFTQYGNPVVDFVKSNRHRLDPDDILVLQKGKATTPQTILNPRHMQDLSLLLVPATELMGGPKWSEANKFFVNDVAKEMNLDAVLIVMSEISWTKAGVGKLDHEAIAEELTLKMEVSTLIPFSKLHERLKVLKVREEPNLNICYRSYKSELKVPLTLEIPDGDQQFQAIEKELLNPLLRTYKDLTIMNIHQISDDLRKTF